MPPDILSGTAYCFAGILRTILLDYPRRNKIQWRKSPVPYLYNYV